MKNQKTSTDSFQTQQKVTEKSQALTSKNNYGLGSEYQNEKVKDFFLSLISKRNWKDDFQFANEPFRNANGADCSYRHPLYGNMFTSGVKELAEQNQCFWLIDFILSTAIHSTLPKDFQVWYLIIKGGKNYIVCDDGNYNVLVAYELSFTDFEDYGSTAVNFYLINDLMLLPQEY